MSQDLKVKRELPSTMSNCPTHTLTPPPGSPPGPPPRLGSHTTTPLPVSVPGSPPDWMLPQGRPDSSVSPVPPGPGHGKHGGSWGVAASAKTGVAN
jgi:hypothetical protein